MGPRPSISTAADTTIDVDSGKTEGIKAGVGTKPLIVTWPFSRRSTGRKGGLRAAPQAPHNRAMQPIQELLNRIRWDPDFGRGNFRLGYYDRVTDSIQYVPLQLVHFPEGAHADFSILDADGGVHLIPYHRVREVYRNDRLIWSREG